LQKSIDTVLVIGTTIKVSNIKYLITEFSCAIKVQLASTVIWVNKKVLLAQLKQVFDVILLSNCNNTIVLLE